MTSIRIISTIWFVLVVATIVAACHVKPDVVYSKPHTPSLPAPPTLSRIPAAAFDCPADVQREYPKMLCINQHTYTILVQRERMLRDYGQQLKAVILAMTTPWSQKTGGKP